MNTEDRLMSNAGLPPQDSVVVAKAKYNPPASVQLSGGKDEDYGAGIGAVVVWVIGIGPAWVW